MSSFTINFVGITGCILILFVFYRTSIGRWTGKSLWYELDNLLGATLLIIYSYEKTAYVNIALNLVWAIVAFRGVSSIAKRRQRKGKSKS
ncbi:MAG TPA: hypothetical protein VK712_04055 [Verrucomicrobiae bacterium]|jgi:hypothetical protein|nr:hypothetical protein [Verrucomicrobiae bacterium]